MIDLAALGALAMSGCEEVARLLALPLLLFGLLAWCAQALRERLTLLAIPIRPLRLLLWLGVACHEWGHALAAYSCGSRVRQVHISWKEGFVRHDKAGLAGTVWIAAGPLVASTLLAVGGSRLVFGSTFQSEPFLPNVLKYSPRPANLLAWLNTTWEGLNQQSPQDLALRLGVLLCLGGCLSAAVPSRHDMRQSAPGWLALGVLLVVLEIAGRANYGLSFAQLLSPWVHLCCTGLASSLLMAVLAYLAFWPFTVLLRRS